MYFKSGIEFLPHSQPASEQVVFPFPTRIGTGRDNELRGFTPLEIAYLNKDNRNASIKIVKKKCFLSLTGFTLVELLLAIGIFAAVALAIISTFGTGVNAWRKSQGILDRYQQVRLVLDRWSWELRNSLKLDVKEITALEADFVGEKEKTSFFVSKKGGIKNITYLVVEEDGDLLLKRLEQDLTSILDSMEKEETVLDRLKEVHFSYLVKNPDGEYEFKENLEETDDFQGQIKLKLIVYVPTGKYKKFEEVTFEKYVQLPVAEIQ